MNTLEENIRQFEEQLIKAGYDAHFDINTRFKGTLQQITNHKEVRQDIDEYGIAKIYAIPHTQLNDLFPNKNYKLDYVLGISYTQDGFLLTSTDIQLRQENQPWEATFVEITPDNLTPVQSIVDAFGKCIPNTQRQPHLANSLPFSRFKKVEDDLKLLPINHIAKMVVELNRQASNKRYGPVFPMPGTASRDERSPEKLNNLLQSWPDKKNPLKSKTLLAIPSTKVNGEHFYQFEIRQEKTGGFGIKEIKIMPRDQQGKYTYMTISPLNHWDMPTKEQLCRAFKSINEPRQKIRKTHRL